MPPGRIRSRRDFLRLAGLVSVSAALAACAPAYARLGGAVEPRARGRLPGLGALERQALGRLTFGPRQSELRRLAEIGLGAWIEEQLAPEWLDDGPVEWRLRQLETLGMGASELADLSDRLFDNVDRRRVPDELRQATLLRQVYSRRQLYEVMVEFWSDHFNISVDKGDCFFLKAIDDREVIRPRALGRFADLLQASAHSPAMLVYLDNQANVRGAPNENYARELMELHTLGITGGYTQTDVMELARALTGWTVKAHFWRGQFRFDAAQHDPGTKHLLGLTLEPEGQREAEHVLEHLAQHPSTARFVAGKLARRFLGDNPPAALVDKAAKTFLSSQGDVKAILRVVLLDGLTSPAPLAAPKLKRPVHYVASALRALNAETDAGPAVQVYLSRMGQAYFGWPTPDGYPDRDEPWRGNLLPRWQFALALARGELEGTRVELPAAGNSPGDQLDELSLRLLGTRLAAGQRAELLAGLQASGAEAHELPPIMTAGLLASPAFQWR